MLPLGSPHHTPFLLPSVFFPLGLLLPSLFHLQSTPLSPLVFLREEEFREEGAGNEQRERPSQLWFRERERQKADRVGK